ncbi:Obg family GTPase CgtA, partial [Bacillus velezensis]|uniref:Obg family GTPase CgtA n=1 Tax=Bacillus velezensis TaxID=492670 RepID=UPI003395EB95
KINDELKLYNPLLAERTQVVAANKMDMPDSEANLEQFLQQVREVQPDIEVLPISSLTRKGIQELLYRAADLLDQAPDERVVEEVADVSERKVYSLDKKEDDGFKIVRENEMFVVESAKIDRMMKRMQLNSHEAILKLARTLRYMGVDAELRKRGAVEGTIVRIGDFEFEFVEGSSYY